MECDSTTNMRILDRYLIKEFSRSIVLTIASLLGIYMIIEFFERLDDVIKSGFSSGSVLKYLGYSIPGILFQILPVAVLLAVLLTLGLMSRNRELLAIKAGGISLYRTTSVLLIIAGLICALSFICQETILIRSNQLAVYYKSVMEGKNPRKKDVRQSQTWFWISQGRVKNPSHSSRERVFNIRLVNKELQELHGIILFELNSRFQVIRRVDAQRGDYRNGIWCFYHGVERIFSPDNFSKVAYREFEKEPFPIPERFEDVFALQKLPEEMTYQELSQYIERLKEAGYPANKHLVDLHAKISMCCITFIMALIGISFAVKIDRSARLFNIGLGLLISFMYWVIFYISISLGHAGAIPPILAAWLGNVIFLCLGIYLFMSIPT
jgi:lipopolysaccharide export system permease protein